MNTLGIDYGTKRIGLAVSIKGIISPLTTIKNNQQILKHLRQLIHQYHIQKIIIGLSSGPIAVKTKEFIQKIKPLGLPVVTVEESVSTIEADQIFKQNRKKSKKYHQQIDAISAAVILRRCQV